MNDCPDTPVKTLGSTQLPTRFEAAAPRFSITHRPQRSNRASVAVALVARYFVAFALPAAAQESAGPASFEETAATAIPERPTWQWRYEFMIGIAPQIKGLGNDIDLAGIPEIVLRRNLDFANAISVVAGVPWYSEGISDKPRVEGALRYERWLARRLTVSATGGLLFALDPEDRRRPPDNEIDPFAEVRMTAGDRFSYGVRVERVRDDVVPLVTLGTAGLPAVFVTAVAVGLTLLGPSLRSVGS